MTGIQILEAIGAVLIALTTIWSGARFARWLRENERIKEDLDSVKVECKQCRGEVLSHHQNVAVHRDPERDEIRWSDLRETLSDMRQEIFRRIEGLESLIKRNGRNV
jgi:hypothetical protein